LKSDTKKGREVMLHERERCSSRRQMHIMKVIIKRKREKKGKYKQMAL